MQQRWIAENGKQQEAARKTGDVSDIDDLSGQNRQKEPDHNQRRKNHAGIH
jgi:hypothetical protein